MSKKSRSMARKLKKAEKSNSVLISNLSSTNNKIRSNRSQATPNNSR